MASLRSSTGLSLQRTGCLRPTNTKAVVPRPLLRTKPDVRVRSSTPDSSTDADFDAFLNKMADKFEKTNNKPAVIGYIAAGVTAFIVSEWLIHLPGMDIILGFPVQLVGLLALPVLGVRYFVDGKDFGQDVGDFTSSVATKLPGLNDK